MGNVADVLTVILYGNVADYANSAYITIQSVIQMKF